MLGSPVRLAILLATIGREVTIRQIGTISRKGPKEEAMRGEIGYYLAGFADGEGSFNVSFRPRNDYTKGWKISLCFNVSNKDKVILALFKRYLGCGTLRMRHDGIWYYEVNNFNAIWEKVIPFFKKYRFLSSRMKRNFSKFCQIAKIIHNGEHLTEDGIRKILKLRDEMNCGGKRKYENPEIITSLLRKSSETIRRTSSFPHNRGAANGKDEEDIVRSSEKSEVNTKERS